MTQKTADEQKISPRNVIRPLLRHDVTLVLRHLKAAVRRWEESAEHVHQLRVSIRKTRVCLQLFRGWFESSEDVDWLERKLKALQRCAGKARDLDILLANGPKGKSGQRIRNSWISKRSAKQDRIRKHFVTLVQKRRMAARCQLILQQIAADRMLVGQWKTWANSQIRKCLSDLVSSVPRKAGAARLHDCRIAARRARYTVEILKSYLPVCLSEELLEVTSELQERLGQFQDAVVSAQAVSAFLKKSRESGTRHRNIRDLDESQRQCVSDRNVRLLEWLQLEIVPRLSQQAEKLSEDLDIHLR